jgi:tRNA(adenine34) deaminase
MGRERDAEWMQAALDEASRAALAGDVPVGAVVVLDDRIIAQSHNMMRATGDPTAHAEVLAIRSAVEYLQSDLASVAGRSTHTGPVERRLEQCTLVVTLEPCAMCAGAIVLARVGRLVFGAWDDKAGMCGSVGDLVRHPRLNHRPQVAAGVLHEQSAMLLQGFFADRREHSEHRNAR